MTRQKERHRARHARSTQAAIDDGTGDDYGNVGAQICQGCGHACSVKASNDEDPTGSKNRSRKRFVESSSCSARADLP